VAAISRRSHFLKELFLHLTAALTSVVLAGWVMKIWRLDWRIPFFYREGGDFFVKAMLVRESIENGWYWTVSRLGAPDVLDYSQIPYHPTIHLLLMKFLSILLGTNDYALIMNIYYMLTFAMVSFAACVCLRSLGVSRPSSMFGAVLYSLLFYHFYRAQMHLELAAYYMVPFACLVVVWAFEGRLVGELGGAEWKWWRAPRFIAAVAVAAVMSFDMPYYPYFLALLLIVALGRQIASPRLRKASVATAVLIAVILVCSLANLTPVFVHAAKSGLNMQAAPRGPRDSEVYGMKMTQLVFPVSGHRVTWLRNLKAGYLSRSPLINENDSAALGTVGTVGFIYLLYLVLTGRKKISQSLNSVALVNITCVLIGTIGGLGAVISFVAFSQIRCYTRISIFIAFFALLAAGVMVDEVSARVKGVASGALRWVVSGVIIVFGALDQTTPGMARPAAALERVFSSDQEFVNQIEASLPKGSMVLQLPLVPFPHSPPTHHMVMNSHMRAYLQSKSLRWSYGAVRNTDAEVWQRNVAQLPAGELVKTLALSGFRGIYVDRWAYQDGGKRIQQQLSTLLDQKPLNSRNGRLFFFSLVGFENRLRRELGPKKWDQLSRRARHPYALLVDWGPGCYFLESQAGRTWRWCRDTALLTIRNPSDELRRVRLAATIYAGGSPQTKLKMESDLFQDELTITQSGTRFTKSFPVPPGAHEIKLSCGGEPVRSATDPRFMVFRVEGFELAELE